MTQLTPLLSRLLDLAQKNALTKSQLQSLQCLFKRFDKDIACHLTVKNCALQLFCKAVGINKSGTSKPQEIQIQEMAIKQVREREKGVMYAFDGLWYNSINIW